MLAPGCIVIFLAFANALLITGSFPPVLVIITSLVSVGTEPHQLSGFSQ